MSGDNAFGFAAAEPKAAFGIERAAIAETMIGAFVRRNLGERGSNWERIIVTRDNRTGGDDFADLAGGKFVSVGQSGEGRVRGGDDFNGDLLHGATHARSEATGGGNFIGGNTGERQRFGGAVRTVQLAVR